MHNFSLQQCRSVVNAVKHSTVLSRANSVLFNLSSELTLTQHVADRLYDHNIDVRDFSESFYELCKNHVFLIYHTSTLKPSGFKILINDLVFVFSVGKIDKKIFTATVYPKRQNKYVDIDIKDIDEQTYSLFRRE